MRYSMCILFLLLFNCKGEVKTVEDLSEANSTEIKAVTDELLIVDFEGLRPYLNRNDDKTYVVNFWATWCAPCVKELPYFEEINKNYRNNDVEVILVSLDFPRKYESKLKPFIKEKNLQSQVIAFDDVDQNTWIPAIDESWSGALPATIIYNKSQRAFYERSFDYNELETELKQFIK